MNRFSAAVQSWLVPQWRDAHNWWSVRVNGIGALFAAVGFGIQQAMGETPLFAFAPDRIVWAIMFATCICAIIGRLKRQAKG